MKLSLLIVDHDPSTQALLRSILSEAETVHAVRSLEDARDELEHGNYDAVFVDTALIEETSGDAVREINEACPGTQIVMLGRQSAQELDLFALGENIFGVLPRPLDVDAVRLLVRQLARLRDMSEQVGRGGGESETLKNSRTGLYTERYLHERISAEFQRARRYVFSLSAVLLAVKQSRKGKASGREDHAADEAVAAFLGGFVRKNDVVTHYGAGHYMILLPDTGKKGALIFAARLLAALDRELAAVFGSGALLTAAGVTSFPEDGVKNEMGLLDLVERAVERAERSGPSSLFAFRGLESFDIQNLIPPRKKAV